MQSLLSCLKLSSLSYLFENTNLCWPFSASVRLQGVAKSHKCSNPLWFRGFKLPFLLAVKCYFLCVQVCGSGAADVHQGGPDNPTCEYRWPRRWTLS